MSIDWKKLCADSHQISKDKGWLDTPRSFASVSILFHSELSEALEDYRNRKGIHETYYSCTDVTTGNSFEASELRVGLWEDEEKKLYKAKPCGIPIELADFIIRVCQFVGTEAAASEEASTRWDLESYINHANGLTRRLGWGDFEEALGWAHYFVSQAFGYKLGRPVSAMIGAVLGTQFGDNMLLNLLGQSLLVLQDFEASYNISAKEEEKLDLAKAIQIKQEFNKTRPFRHGNKLC